MRSQVVRVADGFDQVIAEFHIALRREIPSSVEKRSARLVNQRVGELPGQKKLRDPDRNIVADDLDDEGRLPGEKVTSSLQNRDLMALDMKGPARRKVVDKVAASVMLQAWLDRRRLTATEDPAR